MACFCDGCFECFLLCLAIIEESAQSGHKILTENAFLTVGKIGLRCSLNATHGCSWIGTCVIMKNCHTIVVIALSLSVPVVPCTAGW